MPELIPNPFAVQTPEDISAEEAIALFVDVFSDFYKIHKQGHTFIHGPRGSGKSMMFRYMLPDCQRKVKSNNGIPEMLRNLDYFAVYVPIKLTDLHITELERLENIHANLILNEHWMVLNACSRVFSSLTDLFKAGSDEIDLHELQRFYEKDFVNLLKNAGWKEPLDQIDSDEAITIFQNISNVLDDLYRRFLHYIRRIALYEKPVAYEGPICGYLDFFLPLLKRLRRLSFMPDQSIYILIDDADNLSDAQKTVLNTWVSYRSSSDVSIKASTQLAYDNWYTVSGITIDTPHDFSEVNITELYTNLNKGGYRKRLEEIVRKRLVRSGIHTSPQDFFPPNFEQEQKIRQIKKEIAERFEKEGRGNRKSDDVTRYARPNYIAQLKGSSKSGSKYSYAGFEQLVHLSSGVIRYFLESASQMYSEMQSLNPTKTVEFVAPQIQDKIVRQQADNFLYSEFDKIDPSGAQTPVKATSENVKRLRNLVEALGRTFELILVSDAAERRVFSIAFSDRPSKEITDVLKLGVRYGYFHESTLGTKDGTGRTRLYILNRRLAPAFYLDPTSFAGYKFVTSKTIRDAMLNPDSIVGKVKRKDFDSVFSSPQQTLEFEAPEPESEIL